MFLTVGRCLINSFRATYILRNGVNCTATSGALRYSSSKREESDEEFDARYEAYFNRPEIDTWEIRKAMNDLQGMDLVPEPKIIIAALKACRRLNDYALAVRFLEGVKDKCGSRVKEIYPYILQEIRPTLDELGVLTPEEMGYDKPELYCPDVFEKPMFRKKE